jgi:hypothetical protein
MFYCIILFFAMSNTHLAVIHHPSQFFYLQRSDTSIISDSVPEYPIHSIWTPFKSLQQSVSPCYRTYPFSIPNSVSPWLHIFSNALSLYFVASLCFSQCSLTFLTVLLHHYCSSSSSSSPDV